LKRGKRAERDDEDAGVELGEVALARAQLCGMVTAGQSAQVPEENQQNVLAASGNRLQINGGPAHSGQGKRGGGLADLEFRHRNTLIAHATR
jgi:hypothetical protein